MREIKYTDSELKAKMAKFEAKLKPRQKIVAYLREVTDNQSLYFEQEEEPPQWFKKVADVMIMAEIAENDYLRIGSKGTMPNWVNAVIKINTNSITHLDQIRWETATAQWRTDVAKAIVECLECDALKVPVVECMLGQWREATDGELSFDIGQPFDKFCTHLITNIQNHDLYSIEAIKARQNDLQADVKALKTYVWPHFTPTLTRERYANIFERLQKGKYIDVNTTMEQWLVVCGVDEAGQNYKPVNWIAKASLLGVLADTLFDIDRANIWQLVEGAFTIKSKKPNTNTLKNYVSKVDNDYKDKTKGHDDLIRLLQI